MEDHLNKIDEYLQISIKGGNHRANTAEDIRSVGSTAEMTLKKERREANDKKCLCELHVALSSVLYNYIRSRKIAKEIWDSRQ